MGLDLIDINSLAAVSYKEHAESDSVLNPTILSQMEHDIGFLLGQS